MKTIIVSIKTPKPVVTAKSGGALNSAPTTARFTQLELELKYRQDGKDVQYRIDRDSYRYIEENIGSRDNDSKVINKGLFDQIYCIDQVLYKELTRLNLDSLEVFDDFRAGAGLDDDQVASFTKAVKTLFSYAEEVTTQWVVDRKLAEALSCVENRSWAMEVNKFDQAVTAEKLTNDVSKAPKDPATTGDSGLVMIQGYTDTMGYFLEDYVGISRSF